MLRPPPQSTLFPYTTLFRSSRVVFRDGVIPEPALRDLVPPLPEEPVRDRKSTRLNSSHITISYAVFCLKKKKKQQRHHLARVAQSVVHYDGCRSNHAPGPLT